MTREELAKKKKEVINAALEASEKYGYPTGDEPLCLIVEDAFNAAVEALWPVVDDLQLQVDGLEYAHKTSDEQRSKAMTENQKLRAQVAEAKKSLNEAIGEMVCLGTDLEELNNRTRHYPTALLCPEILERCQKTLASLEGVEPVAVVEQCCWQAKDKTKAWQSSDKPIHYDGFQNHKGTLVVWPNPVQEGGE